MLSSPLPIFLFLASVFFLYTFFNELKEIVVKIEKIRKANHSIKSWVKVKGRVVGLGYNLDYSYPRLSEHIEANIADPQKYPADVLEASKLAINLEAAHGKVFIEYEYSLNGDDWVSRSISPFPNENNINMLYKLSIGSFIGVYVNPDSHNESYLRYCSESEISAISNSILIESTGSLKYAIGCLLLIPIYFYSGITI